MRRIVSFSGGKDSTAMLLMMVEKNIRFDDIVFFDTTKEFPAAYEHIKKVESYINKKITRIALEFDYWFGEHVKTKGKNKGQKGYGWPDFKNRWCTTLKREAMRKYLGGFYDTIEYHGIAYNEQDRAQKNQAHGRTIFYPLITWKITEGAALDYCYAKGFHWGGHYKRFSRLSCWCCPLTSKAEKYTLFKHYPDLWAKLKEMDRSSYRKYKDQHTVKDLERTFAKNGVYPL